MFRKLISGLLALFIIAGLSVIPLNAQQLGYVSKSSNFEREYIWGTRDTSGNVILPQEYLYLARIEGCNKILGQEYLQSKDDFMYEYSPENFGDYYLASYDGKLEKLPVDQVVYHGYDWFIAEKDSLWGIIDCQHKWILEPVFINQIAAIGNYIFIYNDTVKPDEDWYYGYLPLYEGMINLSGDTIIPPFYREISPLDWWDQPYFIVEDYNNRTGLFDKEGNTVIPIGDYQIVPSIVDESVWITENDEQRVYYPATGQWITENLEKLTSGLYGFKNGLRLISGMDWNYSSYWTDEDSRIQIYAFAGNIKNSFDHPCFSYPSEDDLYGIVKKSGDTLLPFIYDEILLNEENYFYDINDGFFCISEGTATVKKDYQWALVDTAGKYLTHFFYNEMGKLSGGLAYAEMDGKWGYIDRNGKEAVPFVYDWTRQFKDGLGEVYIIESSGLINASGRVVYKTWTEDENDEPELKDTAVSPVEYDLQYIMEDYETIEDVDYLSLDLSLYTSFPEEYYQFSNVMELYIYGYRLPDIQFQPGKFENLQWLSISDSDLESIPGGISSLTNLDGLEIMGANINTLPAGLFSHSSISYLSLEENQIKYLPKEIPEQKTLAYLGLMSNNISTIPSSITNLGKLDDLNLDNNQISSLPPEIGKMKKLRYLDLSNNQLTELPSEMADLKKLKVLFLSDNQLNVIPTWISELKSLHSLYLENNNIERVPDEVLKMKNLTSLGLQGNPIPEAEKERIIKMRPDLDMFE